MRAYSDPTIDDLKVVVVIGICARSLSEGIVFKDPVKVYFISN